MAVPERILVLGKSPRQLAIVEYWRRKGARVWGENDSYDPDKIEAVIFPVKVTGDIKDYISLCSSLSEGCFLTTGVMTEEMKKLEDETGRRVTPLLEDDMTAIENAIPTAEGLLQYMMMHTEQTIFGSQVLVIGFGRVGETVVHRLLAMQANVTVLTKEIKDIARARERGAKAESCDTFYPRVFDVVINTAPALTVEGELMEALHEKSLILDAASSPGGVDSKQAEKLGIKHFHLPGIPDKTSPRTAGEIIGRAVERFLDMSRGGK